MDKVPPIPTLSPELTKRARKMASKVYSVDAETVSTTPNFRALDSIDETERNLGIGRRRRPRPS